MEVLKDLKEILTSKWANFVAAIVLILLAATLFWIGGYENTTTQSVFDQTWSWQNSTLQKVSFFVLAISLLPIFALMYNQFLAKSYNPNQLEK